MTATAASPLLQTVEDTLRAPVYSMAGAQTGTVEIDPAEFGGKINQQLLHEVVLMYLANQRAGTHFTKRRGDSAVEAGVLEAPQQKPLEDADAPFGCLWTKFIFDEITEGRDPAESDTASQ